MLFNNELKINDKIYGKAYASFEKEQMCLIIQHSALINELYKVKGYYYDQNYLSELYNNTSNPHLCKASRTNKHLFSPIFREKLM